MSTMNALMKHRHGLSSSTHHRLGYPLAGWFSPEPTSVSPSSFILHKVLSNTTRDALKNLGGLGAGHQVRWALRKGIRKSFSESVLTKSKTVADPTRSVTKRVTHTIDQTIATRNNCHQCDPITVMLERNKIALEHQQNASQRLSSRPIVHASRKIMRSQNKSNSKSSTCA